MSITVRSSWCLTRRRWSFEASSSKSKLQTKHSWATGSFLGWSLGACRPKNAALPAARKSRSLCVKSAILQTLSLFGNAAAFPLPGLCPNQLANRRLQDVRCSTRNPKRPNFVLLATARVLSQAKAEVSSSQGSVLEPACCRTLHAMYIEACIITNTIPQACSYTAKPYFNCYYYPFITRLW